MKLNPQQPYFISIADAVLRVLPKETTTRNAANHLILGDTLTYLGEDDGEWSKFNSRKKDGWLKREWTDDKRLLEINFVDIGQGDGCHIVTPDNEVILIDAGEGKGVDGKGGDNMYRFLSWRYNLRQRSVKGVDGANENTPDTLPPLVIDYAIISHPDLDHYYGFHSIFSDPKIQFNKICHNGIIERSTKQASSSTWMYDLGRKVPPVPYKRTYHLWDTVLTHQETIDLLEAEEFSGKFYLKTLVAAYRNNPEVEFQFLHQGLAYLDHFNKKNQLQFELLAPLTEEIEFNKKKRPCLIKLGDESITKNGHSIVFRLRFGKLKILLGGDLNSAAQDYLAQFYSGISTPLSETENTIRSIAEKLTNPVDLTLEEQLNLKQDRDEIEHLQSLIVSKIRRTFGVDIAKACHHGSSDVLDTFIAAIHPLATIISSGDNEPHSHPRPDALGAYGKSSRGTRPLLFSTELARSTKEFSYPIKFYGILKEMEARMNAMTNPKDKAIYKLRMEGLRDSNVAKYGMITVRTDGEIAVIAQKLEQKRGNGQQWDIYVLRWNEKLQCFE